MSLNQWLTDNSQVVSLFNFSLTIILTIVNVWFAGKSQGYSRDSLKQNERVRKENNTPNVAAHFESKNGLYYFHVSNFGTNAAKNVMIKYTEINEVKEMEHLKISALINKQIAFLAPNQNINTFAGSFNEIVNSHQELPILDIKITYYDLDDNYYERNYVLDINIFRGNLYTIEKNLTDLTKEIKEVDRTLSNIERLFHNYSREIIKSTKNKNRFRR
ncbi:hypothetical protein D3C75_406530 [compost metagenome]